MRRGSLFPFPTPPFRPTRGPGAPSPYPSIFQAVEALMSFFSFFPYDAPPISSKREAQPAPYGAGTFSSVLGTPAV